MGLFDFLKNNEKKAEQDKKAAPKQETAVNPVSLESYTFKVENDQIPYHDPGIDMDVKLLVRAEFIFKGNKPDEAAVQSFKDAFAKIDGKVPAKEFTKSANMNMLKSAMRESMVAQGFDVYSVMINWMSYNKEYKTIVYGSELNL